MSSILTIGSSGFKPLYFPRYAPAKSYSSPVFALQALQLLDAQKCSQSGAQNRVEKTLRVVRQTHAAQRGEEDMMPVDKSILSLLRRSFMIRTDSICAFYMYYHFK